MRVGTSYPVLINADGQQFHVSDAVIVEIDGDEVVLEVPGVVVRMAMTKSLALPEATGKEIILSDTPVNVDELDAEDRAEQYAREREVAGDYEPRSSREQASGVHGKTLDSSVLD